MASIKESIVTTHKKTIKGILNLEEMVVEIEDGEPQSIEKLFKLFNGQQVDISITNKSEDEVPEEE